MKMSSAQQQQQRNPRPEDFPELGNRKQQRNNGPVVREEKENNVDDSLRYRSPTRQLRNSEKPNEDSRGPPSSGDRFTGEKQRSQPIVAAQSDRFDKPQQQQQQRFDNDKTHPTDRYESQDRPTRQERFNSGGRRNNDRTLEESSRFDRQQQQNARSFDNAPRGQRNDRDRPQNERTVQNDRPFARPNSGNTPSSGFRTGKNTIEFKNQTRNSKQSSDGSPVAPQQQQLATNSLNKPFSNAPAFSSGRQPQYEYEDDSRVDSHKYGNAKVMAQMQKPDHFVSGGDFEPAEHRAPGDRAITGRQNVPSVNSRHQNQLQQQNSQGPLPLTNPSLLGNAPAPLHHQPQPTPQNQIPTEASRPKRYSTLRQRTTIDPINQPLPPHVQNNALAMHEQQQLMMQDTAMLMQQRQQQQQQQQLQEQIQLPPPNLASTSNYLQQSIPPQNHQQQMLLAAQQQPPQNVAPNSQYQAAYYANQPPPPSQNDFAGPVPSAVAPPPQTTNQYPSQYGVAPPPNPAYMSAAPPPQTNYLTQQQPPAAVVTGQQQSAPVNYGPTAAAAQPQFAPVPTFPAYPPVANYNSVSVRQSYISSLYEKGSWCPSG